MTKKLLSPSDPPPVEYIAPTTRPDILLICEHAGLAIPRALGRLGLGDDLDLSLQHIAWDIGAGAVARGLAGLLGAGLILQNYSRLVIDCNRALTSPQSIPAVSDHIAIPGNVDLTAEEITARETEIFRPYDDLCHQVLEQNQVRFVIALHSFTPEMDGVMRPWHISFLYNKGETYARKFAQAIASTNPHLNIGFNVPYQVRPGHDWFILAHAEPRGVPYVLIEIRNDQIRQDADIKAWATRLNTATLAYMDAG